MNLRNIFKNGLVVLPLYFASSFLQTINEIDVPELQLLASNLKPEECVKLVSFDSHSSLSDAQIQKLAREQSCFRRLVKWVCQLRTVTKNTYPIVNDLLERIGRSDLIACLAEFSMRGSKSPKVVREVPSADDLEDYDGITTVAASDTKSKGKDVHQDTKYSNQTIDKISGSTTIKISLQTAGIVLLFTILLTCCCTLFIRNRIAKLLNKIRGRKKKGKFIPIIAADREDVSKSYYTRKPRMKRKRASSYEMVDTGTQQNNIAVVPKEPEEPPPTGCYKCYKKKRKKSAKRPHR